MTPASISPKTFRLFCGGSGIAGVILLVISFNLNPGPPANATLDQIIVFGNQYYRSILWGGWLQAVAPALIILFAFSLVYLSEATKTLAGWMTFFGGVVLMTVSLIEITFYFSALFPSPTAGILISLNLIHAAQHLYFIVAAPALFIPLGIVLMRSAVLPRIFAWLACLMGVLFFTIGILFLTDLVLPLWVTAIAGVQAIWWLAAAIALIARSPVQ